MDCLRQIVMMKATTVTSSKSSEVHKFQSKLRLEARPMATIRKFEEIVAWQKARNNIDGQQFNELYEMALLVFAMLQKLISYLEHSGLKGTKFKNQK